MEELELEITQYCKRIAKADPKNYMFREHKDSRITWSFCHPDVEKNIRASCCHFDSDDAQFEGELWNFFGPRASEFFKGNFDKIIAAQNKKFLETNKLCSLLEAVIIAVVEEYESNREI